MDFSGNVDTDADFDWANAFHVTSDDAKQWIEDNWDLISTKYNL